MHCSEKECVCSVKKENNLGFYRLHTIWKSDGFFLNITSKDGAWRGEMTPRDVANMSAQLQIEPEAYLSQCREALTSHDGQPGMVYAVENGSFTWKKVLDEDSGMKMRMGSVMVEPTSFVDTIQNLVHAALDCNKKLQRELSELILEKKKVLENKNDLLRKLNELTEVKNTMENDLYAKFLLLLNSKKSKIEVLENRLEEELKNSIGVKSELRRSHNPYEVDTDDGASDLEKEAPKSTTAMKRSRSGSGAKYASKCSRPTKEAPEEQKSMNSEERLPNDEKVPGWLNYPEPGTSGENQKTEKKEFPSTKDEILDFFYGNSYSLLEDWSEKGSSRGKAKELKVVVVITVAFSLIFIGILYIS